MTLYFAYGSNLDLDRAIDRCPNIAPVSQAVLEDWDLVFRGVADVQLHPGRRVYGALYRLTPACEEALDRYEGYRHSDPENGLYRKTWVRVRDSQGRFRRAMLYQMNREGVSSPSPGYLACISNGYKDWGLPLKALSSAVQRVNRELVGV